MLTPVALLALLSLYHMTTEAAAMASSSNGFVRVAIAQLRSTRNKNVNLVSIAKTAGWARRGGAKMLFLPECLGFMGDNAEHTLQNADPPMEEQMMMQTMKLSGGSDDVLPMNQFREILAETIKSCSKSDTNIKSDDDKYTSEEVNQMPITSIISELQVIAQQSDMWISGGGVHTADPAARDNDASSSESKIYNTQQQQDG